MTAIDRKPRFLVLSPIPTHPARSGNRKRVHSMCASLQESGIEVHFAHYPSEYDWKDGIPEKFDAQMRAAWDKYFVIPPSGDTYTPAADEDYGLDEWWDESIAIFLRWISRMYEYDACIVNYVWLSKAFTCLPGHICRILDTHDVFGNRRKMLEDGGIRTEFFHLSADSEARGLERADIVIGITEEDSRYFASLVPRRVLTVPHAEPPREPADRDPMPGAPLRVGYLGADSQLNLGAIGPLIREFGRVAPENIELVVGGSVCSLLEMPASRGIKVLGAVSTPEAFYRSVDVVVSPIFSGSGMNIKVAEALALAKPVVGSGFAFRGFETEVSFHRLRDLGEIMAYLLRIEADRRLLEDMAEASAALATRHFARFERSFRTLLELARSKCVVLLVDSTTLTGSMRFGTELSSLAMALQREFRLVIGCLGAKPKLSADHWTTDYPVIAVDADREAPGIGLSVSSVSKRLPGGLRLVGVWNTTPETVVAGEGIVVVEDPSAAFSGLQVSPAGSAPGARGLAIDRDATGVTLVRCRFDESRRYGFDTESRWPDSCLPEGLLVISARLDQDIGTVDVVSRILRLEPGAVSIIHCGATDAGPGTERGYNAFDWQRGTDLVLTLPKPALAIDLAGDRKSYDSLRACLLSSAVPVVSALGRSPFWGVAEEGVEYLYAADPFELAETVTRCRLRADAMRHLGEAGRRFRRHHLAEGANPFAVAELVEHCARAGHSEAIGFPRRPRDGGLSALTDHLSVTG